MHLEAFQGEESLPPKQQQKVQSSLVELIQEQMRKGHKMTILLYLFSQGAHRQV